MSDTKTIALKFIAVAAAFKGLQAKRPITWSVFLTLHPLIKRLLNETQANPLSTECSLKLSNLVSSAVLFIAAKDSVLPKDYVSLYVWMGYFLIFANKKITQIKEQHSSKQTKESSSSLLASAINKYESLNISSKTFSKVAFLALFAQLLSNFLGHPNSLNNKFLNDTVRNRLFNPVWQHYSVRGSRHIFDYKSLIKTYVKTNVVFLGIVAAFSFKLIKEKWDKMNHGVYPDNAQRPSPEQILKGWWKYCFSKGNALSNLIILPNVLSVILLSLTAQPFLAQRSGIKEINNFFNYNTKLIGFVLSLVSLFFINSDAIDPKLWSVVNLYLFRLILLSKWRIAKSEHLKLPQWNTIETFIMSAGVFEMMRLHDSGVKDVLVGLVGKIM